MEYACSESGIGAPDGESVGEVLHRAAASGGDDGNAEPVGKFGECRAGESVFSAVVVHAREEDFACAALLCFVSPFEEVFAEVFATAFDVARPMVVDAFCIDGNDAHLTAETGRDVGDELRTDECRRVD